MIIFQKIDRIGINLIRCVSLPWSAKGTKFLSAFEDLHKSFQSIYNK